MTKTKKLKAYSVDVVRTSYAFQTIAVDAANVKDAKDKALEIAGGLVFDEKTADYDIESVTPAENVP